MNLNKEFNIYLFIYILARLKYSENIEKDFSRLAQADLWISKIFDMQILLNLLRCI